MREAAVNSRYRGPSALGGSVQRFASLTFMLAATEFKLRWFGSALGYVWTLVRPLLLFGVLYVVFTEVVRFGEGVKDYPVYLLTSIVLFTYFAETTGGGVQSLMNRENLLRKMHFPRIAIPISVSLSALFNLGLNLIAVLVFAIISGVQPRLSWLQFPVLVLLLTLLAIGFAMLLSVLYVRFRDIQPIWDVVLQITFYASPVLYVSTLVDPCCQAEYTAQPLAAIMAEMRHAVIDSSAPDLATALGGSVRVLIPIAAVLGSFALGLWVFNRESPRIAEHL